MDHHPVEPLPVPYLSGATPQVATQVDSTIRRYRARFCIDCVPLLIFGATKQQRTLYQRATCERFRSIHRCQA
jgi:hypothetical protein